MKNNFYKFSIAALLFFAASTSIHSQSFGFGCLGLSGFYGGYSQQNYSADGINDFSQNHLPGFLISNDVKFQKGTGIRVGANIFRANFSDVFITVKGFFQFLKEEHSLSENTQPGLLTNKYKLSMNHWGVGVDFGFTLFSIVDLKLVEGGVTIYNSEFTYQTLLNDVQQTELKLSPDKAQLAYYVGSGLVINLIPDYISIEGTAAYSFLKIDNMSDDNGNSISLDVSKKRSIEKGGVIGSIQLNVGFPF